MHQRHFMRRGALNVNSDGKALPIRDGHDLRPLAARGLAHGSASVLGGREAAVDERFLQIQMAFVVERLRENFEEAPKQAGADPVLKSPVAGLIRRMAVREVRPRGPGPQNPKDAVQYGAVLFPGTPSAVFPVRERGQEGADEGPLPVGEVTGMRQRRKGHLARMPFVRRVRQSFNSHYGVYREGCNEPP